MKTFSVIYEIKETHEVVVKAKSQKEARNKLLDVLGDDILITDSWEVKQ